MQRTKQKGKSWLGVDLSPELKQIHFISEMDEYPRPHPRQWDGQRPNGSEFRH